MMFVLDFQELHFLCTQLLLLFKKSESKLIKMLEFLTVLSK